MEAEREKGNGTEKSQEKLARRVFGENPTGEDTDRKAQNEESPSRNQGSGKG